MPSGDEGTGLHAFDDLDPISTVSALNVMPVPEPPRRSPPPAPAGRFPKPPSAPPAPRGGAAARSVPPPPPPPRAAQSVVFEPEEPVEADPDEATKVVPNAFVHDADDFDDTPVSAARGAESAGAYDEFAQAAEPVGVVGPDIALRSGATVAADIDMDWDEEDVQTQLRDEGHGFDEPQSFEDATPPTSAPLVGRPSPFPPAMSPPHSQYPGRPSPFATAPAPQFPGRPQVGSWEDEDEALTRVLGTAPVQPAPALPRAFQPTDSLAPASDTRTLAGDALSADPGRRKLAWAGLAAAAVLGAAFGAHSLFADAEPATMTLVTKPADAEVLVNGKPLSGQTSPFMAQGLEPEIEHTLIVRKPGFAEQTHRFTVGEGEVKPLPVIELEPLRADTGFALASTPEGARIYVDGRPLEQVTPARITDLEPGLHVVRLEHGRGYQPWETQVALASGQVIELPAAKLMPATPGVAASSSGRGRDTVARSSSRRRSGGDRARERRDPPAARAHHASSTRSAASAPASSGSRGTLRVNSRPWAQIYVDGRLIGNTPQLNIPLSPGSHKLKLVNPQLGMTKNLKVDIRAGKVTTKIVEMMD